MKSCLAGVEVVAVPAVACSSEQPVLYPWQHKFFNAGKGERLLLTGRGCGKSFVQAFETRCHLTGEYPEWWEGRKFNHSITAWASESLQEPLKDLGINEGHVVSKNGISSLRFKPYRVKAWQGGSPDVITFDGEPPFQYYTEALTRTLHSDGIISVAATPDEGMTELIKYFYDNDKFYMNVSWADTPHMRKFL